MIKYILFGLICIVVFKFMTNHQFLKNKFKKNNVIVFGYKGTGKDLIFQKVISLRRKEQYFSYPQSYGWNYNKVDMHQVNLLPNDYNNFIMNTVEQIEWKEKEQFNKADIYFSDGGVIIPSHADNKLTKEYKSFPIAYALSRQLWRNNMHVNTQALSRIWVKLREQADSYFKALGSLNVGFGILTKVRYFQEYQSANENLLPFKKTLGGGKQQRALFKQFEATNGVIKDFFIFTWKREIKFDSWYYKKVVFKNIDKRHEVEANVQPN